MKTPTPSKTKQITDHRNLKVWNTSVDLAADVYKLTSKLPDKEKYGLCTQMRKAAVSIASNIAEGAARGSRKDFVRFLYIASDSTSELDTQLIIMEKTGLVFEQQVFLVVREKLNDVKK